MKCSQEYLLSELLDKFLGCFFLHLKLEYFEVFRIFFYPKYPTLTLLFFAKL